MDRETAFEILKKYDKETYDYYMRSAYCFGPGALHYAEYLKRQHESREAI